MASSCFGFPLRILITVFRRIMYLQGIMTFPRFLCSRHGDGAPNDSMYGVLRSRTKEHKLGFPAATYTNQKESDEINERNKQENRKAGTERLRDESLRLTSFPSLFLAKAYCPEEYLGQT